jgi:hypothetical protein
MYDDSNDGYLDDLARRGVKKGKGFIAWCLIILFWMILVGAVLQALGS